MALSLASWFVPLREITRRAPTWAKLVTSWSVNPSARYTCAVSPVRLVKGRTARDVRACPPAPALFPRQLRAPISSTSPRTTTVAALNSESLLGRQVLPECNPWLRAEANAAALAYRSAGTLFSTREIASSTPAGTVARTVRRRGTGSMACRARIACAVEPVNGGCPASIS